MDRIYDKLIAQHLDLDEEMIFLSGPRQVGKTTSSKHIASYLPYHYLNWDDEDHRHLILQGPKAIIQHFNLEQLTPQKPVLAFDEIHKHPDWKNFLKGFYDTYKEILNFIVTGSARLDIYKRGGDSLMGRYFQYRMHPLSIAEMARTTLPKKEISNPQYVEDEQINNLLNFGGFPKPLLNHSTAFHNRWQKLRKQQLLQEDIRDVNVINELHRLELLVEILQRRASSSITYSSLAKSIRVSVDTITRWLEILESFFFCYRIRPWSRNIPRALTKEPKVYLWDWSIIKDPGAKTENFIASHLLKAVHYWTDVGFGDYDLYYIRDTQKREVDFLITKDDEPWFLVEAKTTNNGSLNPNLKHFQDLTHAKHAFQVSLNAEFIDKDCFSYKSPIIVPAKTFLSQLI